MSRITVKVALIVLLLSLLSACGKSGSTSTDSSTGAGVVLVSTEKVRLADLPVWLETVGRLHSTTAPILAAETDGRITLINADTGDAIEVGQLLAEIDVSTLKLQRQGAQAGIDRLKVHIANGERRVSRFETLSEKKLSSQMQLDDAREQLEAYRADYKAAVAQLAIVEDSLTKSRTIAPVTGIIQKRFVSVGDFARRGQALFEVTRPEQLQAWLPFPETVALKIRVGQPVTISSPLVPGESIEGEVTELQPALGLGSRAVMAIVDLSDPGDLRPEATLSGKVLVETHRGAIQVPEISVVNRPAGETVYVIHENRAEAKPVITGLRKDGLVEILSGLDGHEVVATDGAAFLTDGVQIKVMEPGS